MKSRFEMGKGLLSILALAAAVSVWDARARASEQEDSAKAQASRGTEAPGHEVAPAAGAAAREAPTLRSGRRGFRTMVTAPQAQKWLKNKQDGEAFLAANKAKEGVVTLPSGLQYKILKTGHGRKPTLQDTVVAHYRGTRVDGTVFDSSYERNQPRAFEVKKLIKGWSEALQLMPVGSRWQLFVPSDLAYGERGAGPRFPPNSTLVFDVELIAIQDAAAKQ